MIVVKCVCCFKNIIILGNTNYVFFYTLKSANRILLKDMISTFFAFRYLKCRGPPPINLFFYKLIGRNHGKKTKEKKT